MHESGGSWQEVEELLDGVTRERLAKDILYDDNINNFKNIDGKIMP